MPVSHCLLTGEWIRTSFSTSLPARALQVLIAGDNFGCGSSREHAVWALKDYGFQAVISTVLRIFSTRTH